MVSEVFDPTFFVPAVEFSAAPPDNASYGHNVVRLMPTRMLKQVAAFAFVGAFYLGPSTHSQLVLDDSVLGHCGGCSTPEGPAGRQAYQGDAPNWEGAGSSSQEIGAQVRADRLATRLACGALPRPI